MSKLPIVAIIGRANVGKSSLFNRLVGHQQAIVANESGTTRDKVIAKVRANQQSFWLVDTAGFKEAEDDFEATIQEQINEAAISADSIVVVVDSTTLLTEEDSRVAKMALKAKKPVILAINKSDKSSQKTKQDWRKSGIRTQVITSAMHAQGIDDLLHEILKSVPKVRVKEDGVTLGVSLVGRPNVGKSSLFNVLAKKQQAIVSSRAGTTRDVNEVEVTYHSRKIMLRDTAGIRKPGKIEVGVEKFSVLRTLRAIEDSEICCLLLDANELNTHLDQRIAGMVKDAGKSLIIVVTKWDSIEKDAYTRDKLAPSIAEAFKHIWWAPLIFTSSETGQNVSKLLDIFLELETNRHRKFTTSELNRWLQRAIRMHPPAGLKNTHPKLRYITQIDSNPPQFLIQGQLTKFLHWSWKRYLEKEFRNHAEFSGTPIQFSFSDSSKAPTKDGGPVKK